MKDLEFLNESQLEALIRYVHKDIDQMRDKLELVASTGDYDKVANVSGSITAMRYLIADCRSQIAAYRKRG